MAAACRNTPIDEAKRSSKIVTANSLCSAITNGVSDDTEWGNGSRTNRARKSLEIKKHKSATVNNPRVVNRDEVTIAARAIPIHPEKRSRNG
jgi:hypothetical protein